MKLPKTLAVIGSRGMVGSDLMLYLKPKFQQVVGIDKKNYDQNRGKSFDVVINANGNSSKVWAKEHVLEDFAASTTSAYNSIFDFPCKTYIYISSADVYEDHSSKKSTSESQTIIPYNLSSYGFHKYLSECIVRNSCTNYIILRCPMILGTNLKKGPIYDIFHKSSLFISEQSSFQMFTTAEITKFICFILDRNTVKEVFNVGGRGTVAFSKISKYVRRPVKFPKDGKTHIYEMDVSKLHKIYNLKTSADYLTQFLKVNKNS